MFLSEFNYGSSKESGLTGDNITQQARGLAYRNYIEQATTLPFIVGAEWFQLLDEASTGRWYQGYNGERGNCGLISVSDRPLLQADDRRDDQRPITISTTFSRA